MEDSISDERSLEDKIKVILADRSEINNILDLIENLDSESIRDVIVCIDGLGKIFPYLANSGLWQSASKRMIAVRGKTTNKSEKIFQSWLTRNYSVAVKKLSLLLSSSNPQIQERSLTTLMMFLQLIEKRKFCGKTLENSFPNSFLLKVVTILTDGSHSNENVVKKFRPYLRYNDVSYYTLRNLTKIVSKSDNFTFGKDLTSCLTGNVYRLLCQIRVPQGAEDLGDSFLSLPEGTEMLDSSKSYAKNLPYKKAFTDAWTSFLSLSLDNRIHRQVLVMLEEKVFPYLIDPKVLMDFLVDSYNYGGVISILALNSLFVLIQKYNLDYPDFYKKLYSLFTVEIFHLKYRGRFFYLADLFLTSTHLPGYLVAAFIKRMSRLSLRTPPHGVILVVAFVGNLIRRHPNCKILIHQKLHEAIKSDDENLFSTFWQNDPFKEDESDPSLCHALQSSLWELETLRQHYYPGIKSLLELLENAALKKETNVSEYFESSYDSLFKNECKEISRSNAFVEYCPPKGIFADSMCGVWCISE